MFSSKPFQSVVIAGFSVLLGIVGDVFFYSYPLGLNAPLYIVMFLAVAVMLIRVFDQRFSAANALVIVPLLFFAAMIAVVSANYLFVLNAMLVAGLLGIVVCFLTTPEFVGAQGSKALEKTLEWWVTGFAQPFPVLESLAAYLKRPTLKRERVTTIQAVARGCLIALPVIVVFGVLLSSADVVFSDYVEGLFTWINPDSVEDLISHLFVVAVLAWGCMAGLKVILHGLALLPDHARVSSPAQPESAASGAGFRLGIIESGIVLGSVDALFAVFVLIQARYLFGGDANITRTGYTYSEYARRGFFELLTVSFFTLLLVMALDRLTRRPARWEQVFRGMAAGVILLTLVILASAFQRLKLYEDAYGYTRLRVISHVFTVWLAVLFVLLVLNLYRVYPHLFWLGSALAVLGFFATLNLINVDAFIADQNIERYHKTGKIDVEYLTTLSDDAVPAMTALLDDLPPNFADHRRLVRDLWQRLDRLDRNRDERRFLGYHYGAARAWTALDNRRDELAMPNR